MKEIIDIIAKSQGRYGYRRVKISLRNRGIVANHKGILRIMKANGLLCTKFTRRNRKYSSFKGEVVRFQKSS